MSVKIKLFYPQLQQFIGNRESLDVSGRTVGECLLDLITRFPGTGKFIFDEQGKYLKHVFIYINAESANKAGLNDPVKDGDKLLIAVLITGG
jgi:molybdopterin converting factor small subunit